MSNSFRFGISSWSYPWAIGPKAGPQPPRKLTAVELIEKAHQLGVKLVQIADNLPLENLSDNELKQVKNTAEGFGISIEVGTKGLEEHHLLRFLELAKFFKSPLVRVLPALFGVRVPIEEVKERLLTVLPSYEEANIVLALENQEAYLAREYAELMMRINHPNIRICLDLANALGAMEGPDYVMNQLVPYCGNYHFKDVKIIRSQTAMGFTVEGTVAGEGKIPFRKTLDLLKKNHLFPSVIIELWPPLQETMEQTLQVEEKYVRDSVEFMKTVKW